MNGQYFLPRRPDSVPQDVISSSTGSLFDRSTEVCMRISEIIEYTGLRNQFQVGHRHTAATSCLLGHHEIRIHARQAVDDQHLSEGKFA